MDIEVQETSKNNVYDIYLKNVTGGKALELIKLLSTYSSQSIVGQKIHSALFNEYKKEKEIA
jgi:hypothetical protein